MYISAHRHQSKRKTPLYAAERQRLCRLRRSLDPKKVAEVKRKAAERYHARKKLVKDMTPEEHSEMKQKWKLRKRKEKLRKLSKPYNGQFVF